MTILSSTRHHLRPAAALAVCAAFGLIGAGQAAAADGAPAAPAAHHDSCLTVSGLTEQTETASYTGSAAPYPDSAAGEALVYSDTVFDAADAAVGHAVGYADVVFVRKSDGHVFTEYHHTEQLAQGTFNAEGLVDRTAMLGGGTVVLAAQGTGGQFAGKTGTFTWKLQQVPPVLTTPVDLVLTLCG